MGDAKGEYYSKILIRKGWHF